MKTYIENKPLQRIFLIVFPILVIGMTIFFTIKYNQFKNELKDFKEKSVFGIVKGLKELTRGSYDLYIKQGAIVNEYALPNFYHYIDKVQIGDSLFKSANSMIFQLYKKKGQDFAYEGEIKVYRGRT
jgi:hypothetical protein